MPSVCWASGRGYQFSPSSVHFKGEISDALPRKRHQKRHLEFCTAYLLSRGSGVRVSPGAPLHFFSTTCARSDHLLFRQMVGPPNRWPVFNFSLRFKEFHSSMSSNQRRVDFCHENVIAAYGRQRNFIEIRYLVVQSVSPETPNLYHSNQKYFALLSLVGLELQVYNPLQNGSTPA